MNIILGLREHLTYTNAMFTNNLLSYYLVEHGLKVSRMDAPEIS